MPHPIHPIHPIHPSHPTHPARPGSLPAGHLRVMPEFASSGLWRPRHPPADPAAWREVPVRECDPGELGLSASLQSRLQAWCWQYERLHSGPVEPAQEALAQFAAAGLALAQAVQAELPHLEVAYFDEARFAAGEPRRNYLFQAGPAHTAGRGTAKKLHYSNKPCSLQISPNPPPGARMPTHVYSHPDIFLHDAAGHVAMATDRIARIYAQVSAVPGVVLHQAREATQAELERNHSADFLGQLRENTPAEDGMRHYIDNETVLNRHTWRALTLSAGAACQAVDAVLDGTAANAFCVTYAGHHAQEEAAGGFCFTNQAAIAARHALARGAQRVAVLDIDTHSGNGTVLSLMGDERVLFAETFQAGYPGNFLGGFCPDNVQRERCSSPAEFRQSWTDLLAKVAAFAPDIIVVSAGFDAHRADPLGAMGLCDEDYRWVAGEILNVNRRVVACLEGGYNVEVTARCAALFTGELVARA